MSAACGYEGEHYHAPGVDPHCANCPGDDPRDAPTTSLTGVMQAPVATNLDPDTEGI